MMRRFQRNKTKQTSKNQTNKEKLSIDTVMLHFFIYLFICVCVCVCVCVWCAGDIVIVCVFVLFFVFHLYSGIRNLTF